ncbi:MAG: glycosyltransferase family 2 protein [Planctomycetes bacterium]|nr:glycosyltransferase family 2 protein [Planctomycetota bacterium]
MTADPSAAPRPSAEPVEVSVVVPVLDEEPNLRPLHAEIRAALEPTGRTWEVVYVDDGSRDGSLRVMLELWHADPHVRVVQFKKRCGQTSAMAAGFDQSRGRVVVTLDGDLQNDPADIPRLLERIEAGADIVAGWRKHRHDGFFLRKVPSRVANRLIGFVTRTRIHDTGCSLKAFRRELVENLPIYAEQHRFLPAMSRGSGARVEELVVNHRPRRFGRSKYGLGRAARVVLDLMTVKMITSFSQHPLQYFAAIGVPFSLATLALCAAAVRVGVAGPEQRGLAQILGLAFLLAFSASVYFFLLGLLAELVIKASDLHGSERGRRLATAEVGAGGRDGRG